MERIEFFRHNIGPEDIQEVTAVLRSIFLTTGPRVDMFEEKFAQYVGVRYAVAVTSCTGALHLALLRHGVGMGDEVITTPMTFVATVTAILETGARPVLVDVCPKSGLMNPESAERAITARTKAIIPVHLYGRMVDMKAFQGICQRNNLALIEDAAHCIEGSRDGVRPGHLSDAACFSFYATKNITCGEGGAIVCSSAEDAGWYRAARHHGISNNAASRYSEKYEHWDMDIMGWKYNMDDVHAALLIHQIARIDGYRARRQSLEQVYRQSLAEIEGLDFMETPGQNEVSAHHLFTVLLPNCVHRDKVLHALHAHGIGCAVNYRAIPALKYFREVLGMSPHDFPVAHEIGNRTISLPLYPELTEDQVHFVCKSLKQIIHRVTDG
jgi:dTDP-4-amino-4,6-dideoxygalactose transaminase